MDISVAGYVVYLCFFKNIILLVLDMAQTL